ncbi:larval cuticle protein LCP-17-like [Procambarus clarkii]|uniref:larval cuticle protein LCP-17-like n=1 Tax=Procambarus clarkii TaxID=6728 RepID=UPI0037438CA3
MCRVSSCIVLVVLAVVAATSTTGYVPKPVVPILKDDRKQNAYGESAFQYESGDGTSRKEAGTQNDGQVSQGGWRYTSPYGEPVEITFVADHGGYQPHGDTIPVPVPLPYERTGN